MQPSEMNQFSQGNAQGKAVYSRTDQNFYRGSTPPTLLKN